VTLDAYLAERPRHDRRGARAGARRRRCTPPRLQEAMQYPLFLGGKRIARPHVDACEAVPARPEPRYPSPAPSSSFIPTRSCRDDLPAMDDDELAAAGDRHAPMTRRSRSWPVTRCSRRRFGSRGGRDARRSRAGTRHHARPRRRGGRRPEWWVARWRNLEAEAQRDHGSSSRLHRRQNRRAHRRGGRDRRARGGASQQCRCRARRYVARSGSRFKVADDVLDAVARPASRAIAPAGRGARQADVPAVLGVDGAGASPASCWRAARRVVARPAAAPLEALAAFVVERAGRRRRARMAQSPASSASTSCSSTAGSPRPANAPRSWSWRAWCQRGRARGEAGGVSRPMRTRGARWRPSVRQPRPV